MAGSFSTLITLSVQDRPTRMSLAKEIPGKNKVPPPWPRGVWLHGFHIHSQSIFNHSTITVAVNNNNNKNDNVISTVSHNSYHGEP
mmetsp:Transcript_12064/g.29079  ORF Transcript_12064/g.29079 Transcript_12064/m.29079 type:complete len:86 (+) Transcript_12064:484-741(+)